MISDLFFKRKVETKENKLIYEEDFVLFYLKLRLYEAGIFSYWRVATFLNELYGNEKIIKGNQFQIFCEKNLKYKNTGLYIDISEEEKELYRKTTEISKEIMPIDEIEYDKIKEKIENDINKKEVSFETKLIDFIMYYQSNANLTFESKIVLLYEFFCIIKNYYKIYRNIDSKLEKILNIFDVIEITEMNFTKKQLEFLISSNVYTMKNLRHMPIELLICIFSDDIDKFINELSVYTLKKEELIQNLENNFKSLLNSDRETVINKRFCFNINERCTLEDIGNELNITRERVRQIEKRAIRDLVNGSKDMEKIINCFYKGIQKENNNFIALEDFIGYIENEKVSKYLIIISSYKATNIIYNDEYGILYNKNEITLEEIVKQAQSELKDVIPVSDVEEYDVVQQQILINEYKVYQNKVFIRKKLKISELYINEIKDTFINGYNIGNKDDYNELVESLYQKYGNLEIPSMHSIQAMIDRSDLVQVDRGTYKSRELTANLSEELVEEMVEYIMNNPPLVPYSSLFERFKSKLEKLGINNRYYLKGLLDEKIPKDILNTGRDFINTNSEGTLTAYDIMPKIFRTFEKEFTLEDVQEKMPGLKMYSYESYTNAEEKNGLLKIGRKTYIYIDKLNITQEIQMELKKFIDDLFERMGSKVLTAKKIYSNLSIMNKELLKKLNITAKFGDFELFSIIKYLFKNEYYYSRPLICLEEDENVSTYSLIKEYVKRLDKFSYSDVKNYIYKMNLGILYSYLTFMEDLSDEYVQINKDSMIRMEKFDLSPEKLEKIEAFMDLLLSRNNEFRTDDFDGYFMLPKLDRPWNKHILIGIIRSYLKDKYEIENTASFYDTTDFIVRRIK